MEAGDAMPILETPRLALRAALLSDSAFFLRLLNEPSWLDNIGDRGVRSEADAARYIARGIWSQYETLRFGMYVVQLKHTSQPIGLCGLVKRSFLSSPDLGFALLPEYVGHGYAAEASRHLMQHARSQWQIDRLYAIVNPDNHRSKRLLELLGFRYERLYALPQADEVELYLNG